PHFGWRWLRNVRYLLVDFSGRDGAEDERGDGGVAEGEMECRSAERGFVAGTGGFDFFHFAENVRRGGGVVVARAGNGSCREYSGVENAAENDADVPFLHQREKSREGGLFEKR